MRVGNYRAALILGYRGHGRRYGVIPFGNGYTLRAGGVALHIWRLDASGEPPSRLRRLTLCKLSLCETFKTASDETGIWGECQKCGKRVGYVDRRFLREIGRREFEKHQEASRG